MATGDKFLLTGITSKIWWVMYALTSHGNLTVDAEIPYDFGAHSVFSESETTSIYNILYLSIYNIFLVPLIPPGSSLLARLPLSG